MLHLTPTIIILATFQSSFGYSGLPLNFEIIRIGSEIKPEKVWDTSKMKIVRLKPGIYALDGDVELLQTLDNNITLEGKAYYSSTGSGHYTLLPFHLMPTGYCTFFNTNYKKYIMESLSKVSNFPVIGAEYFCPMEKGTFKLNKFIYNYESVKNVVKPGFYKVDIISKMPSTETSIVVVYVKFSSY